MPLLRNRATARWTVFLGLPIVAMVAAHAQEARPPGDVPVFRASVDLVPLTVTVTDSSGQYVNGLQREHFVVLEEGVRQDVVVFAVGEVPLDLAVLIDTSMSMHDRMDTVRRAAAGFVRKLRPGDRGTLMTFGRQVDVKAPLTSDVGALVEAIEGLTAGGKTTLYNAVYIALRDFDRRRRDRVDEVRRQAMVVLSDGADTGSIVTFDSVLELTKRAGVGIYTVSLISQKDARGINDLGRRFFTRADYGMRTLASESGARSFFPTNIAELQQIYSTIAEELAQQYLLAYVPKNGARDGAFRKVSVHVAGKRDARARTRLGYYAVREPTISSTALRARDGRR